MSSFIFDGSVWPIGEEWPAGVLPPPCLTVEIAAVELEVLIEHHDDFGAKAAAAHEHETELFHAARDDRCFVRADAQRWRSKIRSKAEIGF